MALIFPQVPTVFTLPSFEQAYTLVKRKCNFSEMTSFFPHRVSQRPIIVNNR